MLYLSYAALLLTGIIWAYSAEFMWTLIKGKNVRLPHIAAAAIVFTAAAVIIYRLFPYGDSRAGLIIQYVFTIPLLVLTAIYDVKTRTIPTGIIILMLIGALLPAAIYLQLESLLIRIALGAALFAAAFIISRITKEQLGMGDVKLLGSLAIALGLNAAINIIIFAMAAAFIISIILLALKKIGLKGEIPFVPFIAFGTAAYFVLLLIG